MRLAPLTTLRLGGPAGRLIEAHGEDELVAAVRDGADLVLAGGSNVVIADAGVPGTVLLVRTRGIVHEDDLLVVQAGEPWDEVVAHTVASGLQGFECLSGIPGSTGATPIQNVGAYGQDVSETVAWVRVYDRETDAVSEMSAAECGFDYRTSVFKYRDRWTVLAVAFRLRESGLSGPLRYAELARTLGVEIGAKVPTAAARSAVLGLRRGKGMVLDAADHDTWSAGSFFTNPVLDPAAADSGAVLALLPADAPRWPESGGRVKISAAWLIEKAGFARGYGVGQAQVSGKHTLALTNRGGATTEDLLALAREIRDGVRDRFGVTLVNEPVLVGVTL